MPRRQKSYPQCGRITFKVNRKTYNFYVNAYMAGEEVGDARLCLYKTYRYKGRVAIVKWIGVKQPGCGIGTRLYERLHQIACRNKARLMSDTMRSNYSEGFWKKQKSKGRAIYIADRDLYIMKKACPKSLALTGAK